ncbi:MULTISPECIES: hypothetical protein [Nocardia]|uniref:hypothetical protein n=1 Tax=Nocardia TaxID=1817 RepID=UPI000D68E625|nr:MULTISPECIES: hypothetical protein [Nocardia]
MTLRRRAAAVLLGCLLTAGCAAADPAGTESATTTAPGDPASVVVDVRIAAGSVSPVDQRREAKVGQPVEIVVDSDTTDELHVHATPEHTFPIAAATGQRFRFTVDIPGRVELELHRAHRTVVTLLVRG